jgi:hypothetical protein
MLEMSVFIDFNSVLFTHYHLLLMPLLPLAVGEWVILSEDHGKE